MDFSYLGSQFKRMFDYKKIELLNHLSQISTHKFKKVISLSVKKTMCP